MNEIQPRDAANRVCAGGKCNVVVTNSGKILVMKEEYKDILEEKKVERVSVGDMGVLVLKEDGKVYYIEEGRNGRACLKGISDLVNISDISVGEKHIIAIDYDRRVMVCQLGDKATKWSVMEDVYDAVSVSAGIDHSVVLLEDGSVLCWGCEGRRRGPDQVLKNAVAISAGGYHGMALTKSGEVVTWGSNNYGQRGCGNSKVGCSPSVVGGLSKKIVSISAGKYRCIACDVDGGVYVWGRGVGSKPYRLNLENVVNVSGGEDTDLALDRDGKVYKISEGVMVSEERISETEEDTTSASSSVGDLENTTLASSSVGDLEDTSEEDAWSVDSLERV